MDQIRTACAIAGGGPAGMMLGFLLARAGVSVVVLEKHADFLRDFRGDTIHPSTLEVIYELGLIEEFLARPHQEIREVGGQIGNDFIPLADLTHLPTHCKFLGFMPQWDFLDFISEHGARYPTFKVKKQAEVIDLLEDPTLAHGDQILAVPTLVRKLPMPVRRIIGDLSNTERVLVGLDLRPGSVPTTEYER